LSIDLGGKTVLVTGASSGIGEACSWAFARAGCRLMLLARRRDRLERLAAELEADVGADVLLGEVDVRDPGALGRWFADVDDSGRTIDILVNNAGLARGLSPIHEGDLAAWEQMVDTNVKGLLYVTRAVVPKMVSQGSGHVIHIGSIAGHEVYPNGNVYCATKHAVSALNRSMAIDLLGTGVRVSSVDPGMVATEFSLVRFDGDADTADEVYRGLEPLRADDVADAVLYCATRPPHANVREMILMPTAQATAVHVHRVEKT